MIIRRTYLWSFQAFIFLTAGGLEDTFILLGLACLNGKQAREIWILWVRWIFCQRKQISVLVINLKPKPLNKQTKNVSALARAFISLFQLFHLLGVKLGVNLLQAQWTATPWGTCSSFSGHMLYCNCIPVWENLRCGNPYSHRPAHPPSFHHTHTQRETAWLYLCMESWNCVYV